MADMKLELVPVPVRNVDVAIKFYAEQLGFVVDHDTAILARRQSSFYARKSVLHK